MDNNKNLTKPGKKADISRVSSPISLRSSKKVLEKSKFYKDKDKTINNQTNTQSSHSCVQVSKINIKNIIKIRNNFLNFSAKKIEEVYKVLNMPKNNKPRLNMIDGFVEKTSFSSDKLGQLRKIYNIV